MHFRASLGIVALWALGALGTVCLVSHFDGLAHADIRDPLAPIEQRIQDVLQKMTLEEKVLLLSGDTTSGEPNTGFKTHEIPRLGIPAIEMNDGPLGVRFEKATAFPSGILMASSFDPELVGQVATAIAQETKAYGHNMLLGPCIGISRVPLGGRNFESYGEDPFLTTQMAVNYVKGLQSQGVLASTKHFALNDQEYKRTTINVVADERTMQEIHLPAFHAAVDAGTWSIMASYNLVNGLHASENPNLLTSILKEDWGFKGFVISDWYATHSTVAAANAGLDLEMPSGVYFGNDLLVAAQTGLVSEATINDKVARILRAMIGSGIFDAPAPQPNPSAVGSADHLSLAQRVAENGLVLLKNTPPNRVTSKNVLPIDAGSVHRLAVIGAGAAFPRTGGGGSSLVTPTRVITPLSALNQKLREKNIVVDYAVGVQMNGDFAAIQPSQWRTTPNGRVLGVTGEYFDNMTLSGQPKLTRVDPNIDFHWNWLQPDPSIPANGFSVRWTGYLTPPATDTYTFSIRVDDGARLYINDQLVINAWHDEAATVYSANYSMTAGQVYKIRMEYYQDRGDAVAAIGMAHLNPAGDLQEAIGLAKSSDVAIVFAGLSAAYEGEGMDRASIGLPAGQDELISKVAAVNPNTIVVINAGNPVTMPWLSQVKGVLYAWYAGQEGGSAIADALLGTVNPSGKLPVSFPKRWEDASAYGAYPEDAQGSNQVTYSEKIYVGYRHFDTHGVDPLFPFGFGLSYTTFSYSNFKLNVTNASVTAPLATAEFDVTNTGTVAGAEVAQLYVHEDNPVVDRPVQELKGFKKLFLRAGETQHVSLPLDSRSFAYYDIGSHSWTVHQDVYEIRVGASSRDARLKGALQLSGRGFDPSLYDNAYRELPISAGEPAIKYVGRFDHSDSRGPKFSWTGSQVIARFNGSSVAVKLAHERMDDGEPIQYTYIIDGGPRRSFAANLSTTTYSLASGLSFGPHDLMLERETEGVHGYSQFLGFDFGANGALLPPFLPSQQRMEVIGDSISAGYGDIGNPGCHFSTATESAFQTYEAITARALGMDLSTVAFSGKGIHNNWNTTFDDPQNPTMLHDFLYALTPFIYTAGASDEGQHLYDFASPADLVVINLGTNDFRYQSLTPAAFVDSYKQLVALVRSKYPASQVFAVVGSILEEPLLDTLRASAQQAVNELKASGDKNIFYVDITQTGTHWSGCDDHPGMQQNIDMAQSLIASIHAARRH